jgi:hypothetical protein
MELLKWMDGPVWARVALIGSFAMMIAVLFGLA